MSLLEVNNLGVRFQTQDALIYAVNGINFSIERGQTLGIVGESGSGKSQSVLAMMGLLARNGVATGQALYKGDDLLAMKPAALNKIRGNRVAMIFQDPMTSLNPYLTVERQMTEVLQFHKGMNRKSARARSVELLDAVKIPEAASRITMYPHEFSGGMRQRVMIAMSLLCEPEVLIADEPTTALDVTVQAQILALLRDLQRDFGTAIVMITHDLGVVAGLCDEVMVLYGERVMEQGAAESIFYGASHPYTVGLLKAIPRLDAMDAALVAIPGRRPIWPGRRWAARSTSAACWLAPIAARLCRCCKPPPAIPACCGPAIARCRPWPNSAPGRPAMLDAAQPILSVRDLKVHFQVSALDVSIQAQIINLLKELQQSVGLALIFIAHDLAVVKHISDRILVMYLGRAMELAHRKALYTTPRHPYTRALLSAIPIPDPRLERQKSIQILQGDLPSPINPPSGCVFRTRCPQAIARCASEVPELRRLDAQSEAACLQV